MVVFGLTLVGHFVVLLLMLVTLVGTNNIRYTRLFNPILLFLPLAIGYSVLARVGVVTHYFYPRYPSLHLASSPT
jgi:hypothetical protein